jgi:hypothetical protein
MALRLIGDRKKWQWWVVRIRMALVEHQEKEKVE